jgi:DNA-directed RNA polymerase subunit E'
MVTIKDIVRIPPKLFSKSLEKSVLNALREQYEGRMDKDLGVVITVANPREIGDGKIIPGDGAAYHNAVFDVLVFKPELHEMVKGKIIDITEFGAFVRFGPIDGLVHVSQVTDDFMSYNDKTTTLAGKDSKKILQKKDVVNARIIAISLKSTVTDSKINLTMRQLGLGKEAWYKGVKAKKPGEKKPAAKKKKKSKKR